LRRLSEMNSGIRLPLLLVAACALASAAASHASGRQTGRRGVGNSAEIEHRERERREREMNNRDMDERQFMLRNLRVDGGKGAAALPGPRLAVAQIREDFARLQVVNNDLARAVSGGGVLDLKFVSKSASEIRKLAGRLKENMALPEPSEGQEGREAKAAPGQLGPALSALDGMILAFADDIASKGVYQIDARSSAKARRELEAIITLSEWVKKTSEKSRKATSQTQ
jgi:hypothetical protein